MKPATAKPFLFEQSFDEEAMQRARERKLREKQDAQRAAELAELQQEPPPPTFSEEEMQAAQAAAWQEGHQAGTADAEKTQEAQTLILLENIGAQISGIHVHQDLANERIAAELSSFAVEVCRRILPSFVESQAGGELRDLLSDCLEKISPASRILISVAPESVTLLEPQIDALAARSGFEGRMKLIADPALAPTDLIATWDGGTMERIEKDIWDGIEAVVARTRAAAPASPELPAERELTTEPDSAPATEMESPSETENTAPEEMTETPAEALDETRVETTAGTEVSEEDPNV